MADSPSSQSLSVEARGLLADLTYDPSAPGFPVLSDADLLDRVRSFVERVVQARGGSTTPKGCPGLPEPGVPRSQCGEGATNGGAGAPEAPLAERGGGATQRLEGVAVYPATPVDCLLSELRELEIWLPETPEAVRSYVFERIADHCPDIRGGIDGWKPRDDGF